MYLVSVDPMNRSLLTILLTQNVFRENIEVILQETLFEPSALLETTVAEAMTQVLEIRDSILERTKKIRQKDESITICPEQDVNQDQFLTTARMEVMTVLLSLIEQEAATPEKLPQTSYVVQGSRNICMAPNQRALMLNSETIFPSCNRT